MDFFTVPFIPNVTTILSSIKKNNVQKKVSNEKLITIAVGDNFNDLDMLRNSDFPCLVFNDKFTLDEIPINNLIISNKPSPEGWADVIKMALVKINKN